MEILDNMIINKLNYLDFYYFGKNKQEIVSKELLKKLNIDINLKKHIFYKHNDHIKYYLCYTPLALHDELNESDSDSDL